MRYSFGVLILTTGLAACSTQAPNDGGEYWDNITPIPTAIGTAPANTQQADLDTQPQTVRPPADTPTPVNQQKVASNEETVTVDLKKKEKIEPDGDGSISNSQNFEVVKSKESIESDAEKLERLKNNYEIVEPGAAPVRDSRINLAKFALSQTNPVGQKAYSRNPLKGRKAAEKCASFGSADEAQTDFLKRGGPQRDSLGIDPDGDGYACRWSPAVYRSLIGQ